MHFLRLARCVLEQAKREREKKEEEEKTIISIRQIQVVIDG
jgi:hypothetical protein